MKKDNLKKLRSKFIVSDEYAMGYNDGRKYEESFWNSRLIRSVSKAKKETARAFVELAKKYLLP